MGLGRVRHYSEAKHERGRSSADHALAESLSATFKRETLQGRKSCLGLLHEQVTPDLAC